MYGTRVYNTWKGMVKRCVNPNDSSYHLYGGRGISVCDRWKDSFEAFYEDMGDRPKGHTIDRIDNDGDYEPGNCRWAPEHVQQRNRRSTRMVTFRGETKCLTDWAEETGIQFSTLSWRLRNGWSIERTLTEQPN